jgi:hypothetical protein
MDIKQVITEINSEVGSITDPATKGTLTKLLNLLEFLLVGERQLREENQKLRDEINRMKGEQGKPNIRGQTPGNQDFSSEKERHPKNKKKNPKSKKKNNLSVDRVEICQINPEQLPPDAVFKGHHSVIVQDILIKTHNVEFKKATYYSPSLRRTFIAPLPAGYVGEFGPTIKGLTISLYHKSHMTESAIVAFFKDHGIHIGCATVSRFLTDSHDDFHREKDKIVEAGLRATIYQQMDDTGARVNGKNYYAHILCNEFFTAYFTRRHKDRLTIIEILTQGEIRFAFNEMAFALMEKMNLSSKALSLLRERVTAPFLNQQEVNELLKGLFSNPNKHLAPQQIILEASALTAYQQLPHAVEILLTDDAPQYNQIAHHALCWVHDGRHYKKLMPMMDRNRELLEHFLEDYWSYYDKLLVYKEAPTPCDATVLSDEFDKLFATKTGYDKLDDRIKKTKAKKDELLVVLQYPAVPLHNNASELGARSQARRRDISFQTVNEKGTTAKDTFMTLNQTAKKLAVNFFDYIRDRITKKYEMPSLASLILQHSPNLICNTS